MLLPLSHTTLAPTTYSTLPPHTQALKYPFDTTQNGTIKKIY